MHACIHLLSIYWEPHKWPHTVIGAEVTKMNEINSAHKELRQVWKYIAMALQLFEFTKTQWLAQFTKNKKACELYDT